VTRLAKPLTPALPTGAVVSALSLLVNGHKGSKSGLGVRTVAACRGSTVWVWWCRRGAGTAACHWCHCPMAPRGYGDNRRPPLWALSLCAWRYVPTNLSTCELICKLYVLWRVSQCFPVGYCGCHP
jgi:hypothetical protein